jgi:hypothetical protein
MKRRDVSEADDVFRRSHTKKERTREMFFGQKKKSNTNLDFPFSQALVESGFSICLSKRSGGRGFAWLLSLTTRRFATKTRWMRERALLNNKRINNNKKRINNNEKRINNNEKRINTITNDEIVTTPEENKHRSIETSAKRRRRTISERERSKSARAIWTFP